MRTRYTAIAGLALILATSACADNEDAAEGLSTSGPTSITRLPLTTNLENNFRSPSDAVSSPDGSTFYFIAQTVELTSRAAIYSVSSQGGPVTRLAAGNGLSEPTGLLMSCDGSTLYVADLSYEDDGVDTDVEEEGAILTLDLETNQVRRLESPGIEAPTGLAMGHDCERVYVTGYNSEGEAALFTIAPEGGDTTQVTSGAPLDSPSGVFADSNDIAWIMDQDPNEQGGGTLFAVEPDGTVSSVISDLRVGAPAGVSLAAGGVTAVIPDRDNAGNARLVSVNTVTGEREELPAPEMKSTAGIRTASKASVFVVVDKEGGAIFRAE